MPRPCASPTRRSQLRECQGEGRTDASNQGAGRRGRARPVGRTRGVGGNQVTRVNVPGGDHPREGGDDLLKPLQVREALDHRIVDLNACPGGFHAGHPTGRTDATGGYPDERPVSPKDILATLYHLMGVDPHIQLIDRTGRPMPLVAEGEVVKEMIV